MRTLGWGSPVGEGGGKPSSHRPGGWRGEGILTLSSVGKVELPPCKAQKCNPCAQPRGPPLQDISRRCRKQTRASLVILRDGFPPPGFIVPKAFSYLHVPQSSHVTVHTFWPHRELLKDFLITLQLVRLHLEYRSSLRYGGTEVLAACTG